MKSSNHSPLLLERLRKNRLAHAIALAMATLFTIKIAEAEAEDAVVMVDSDDLNQPSAAGLDIDQLPGQPSRAARGGLLGATPAPIWPAIPYKLDTGAMFSVTGPNGGSDYLGSPLAAGEIGILVKGDTATSLSENIHFTGVNGAGSKGVVAVDGGKITLDSSEGVPTWTVHTANKARTVDGKLDKSAALLAVGTGSEIIAQGGSITGDATAYPDIIGVHALAGGQISLSGTTVDKNTRTRAEGDGSTVSVLAGSVVHEIQATDRGHIEIANSTIKGPLTAYSDGTVTVTSSIFDQSGRFNIMDGSVIFDGVTFVGNGSAGTIGYNGGNLTIKGSTITDASDLLNDGTLTITDSTFNSDTGVAIANEGGQAVLDNVIINNGAWAGLVVSGDGTTTVSSSAIYSAGHAVDTYSGITGQIVEINDSSLTSSGDAVLYMRGDSATNGQITLNNSLVSGAGQLIHVDDKDGWENHGWYSVSATSSHFQSTSGQGFHAQKAAGLDVHLIDSTLDLGENGRIAEAVLGTEPDGGDVDAEYHDAGNIRLTSLRTDLKGTTLVDSAENGRLDLSLQDATWTMTGESNLTDLTMNSGSAVQFQPGGAFKTLTVEGDLSGSGMFAMNTDLASEQGDLLKVLGNTSGSHSLLVADSGNEPGAANGQLMLVDGNGGDGSFALAGRPFVDAGAFRYSLEQQGDDWFLRNTALVPVEPVTPVDPVIPVDPLDPVNPVNPLKPDNGAPRLDPRPETLSAGANAALGNQAATATLWNAEMNALVKRLGELRMGEDNGGVWTRGIGKTFEVDNGDSRSFDQDVHGMEIGADTAIALDGGKLYVGGMVGAAKSTQNYGDGSSGEIDSKLIGAYATWLDDNGYYVDTVAKYNRMDNEVKTTSNTGEQVKGSYKTDGYGADVEVGKHIKLNDGWFVEPQAELTYTHTEGASYTASNGLKVDAGDADSLQGRVGALFGKSIKLDNGMAAQPYVKASYVHEFNGDSTVTVNGFELDNQVAGSRTEVGVGGVLQVSEKTKVSLDVEHAKGSNVEEPWAVNLGVRYLW